MMDDNESLRREIFHGASLIYDKNLIIKNGNRQGDFDIVIIHGCCKSFRAILYHIPIDSSSVAAKLTVGAWARSEYSALCELKQAVSASLGAEADDNEYYHTMGAKEEENPGLAFAFLVVVAFVIIIATAGRKEKA